MPVAAVRTQRTRTAPPHCNVCLPDRIHYCTKMELGTNITAKLEPFLLMSKSAKGAAAAKLVQDATSAPGVFVFAELLEQPNIQEVCQRNIHSIK